MNRPRSALAVRRVVRYSPERIRLLLPHKGIHSREGPAILGGPGGHPPGANRSATGSAMLSVSSSRTRFLVFLCVHCCDVTVDVGAQGSESVDESVHKLHPNIAHPRQMTHFVRELGRL
jgi:hypothetical protein